MKKEYLGYTGTQIERNTYEEGKSIEQIIREALATNAPIEATVPMVYTEKKDGVLPQYDIRTDRQELALDALDKFNKSEIARSDNKPDTEVEKPKENQTETTKTE